MRSDGWRTWGIPGVLQLPEHPNVPQAFIFTRQTPLTNQGLIPPEKGLEKPIPAQGCARGWHSQTAAMGYTWGCGARDVPQDAPRDVPQDAPRDVPQDAPSAHFPGKESAERKHPHYSLGSLTLNAVKCRAPSWGRSLLFTSIKCQTQFLCALTGRCRWDHTNSR